VYLQHCVQPIVEEYPRHQIRNQLEGIKWYAVDIVRIGYSAIAAENPVTVVTVKPGSVPYQLALRLYTIVEKFF
jgi:hypothetical protein